MPAMRDACGKVHGRYKDKRCKKRCTHLSLPAQSPATAPALRAFKAFYLFSNIFTAMVVFFIKEKLGASYLTEL